MKIELKKVQYVARMSQETECFVARIWVDGVDRGEVSNDGHGGCHRYESRSVVHDLDAYGATLPPKQYAGMQLKMDADMLVGDALGAHLEEKKLRTLCKKKTVFRLPEDKEGEYRTMRAGADVVEHLQKTKPTAEIINLRFA